MAGGRKSTLSVGSTILVTAITKLSCVPVPTCLLLPLSIKVLGIPWDKHKWLADYPRRRNATTSMAGLRMVTYAKFSPKKKKKKGELQRYSWERTRRRRRLWECKVNVSRDRFINTPCVTHAFPCKWSFSPCQRASDHQCLFPSCHCGV